MFTNVSYPPHVPVIMFVIYHSVAGCNSADLIDDMYSEVRETLLGYTFSEGVVTYTGLFEGSTATYMPKERYSLSDGSSYTRICLNNGLWSGSPPRFEIQPCRLISKVKC